MSKKNSKKELATTNKTTSISILGAVMLGAGLYYLLKWLKAVR